MNRDETKKEKKSSSTSSIRFDNIWLLLVPALPVRYIFSDAIPSRSEKIRETVVLSLINVALPTFDVYSDLWVGIKFFMGSRRHPLCDDKYEEVKERIRCYYEEAPIENMTYTPHLCWGTMMFMPYILNYLICWYVWATTDKRKAVTWIAVLLSFYPQYIACKIIYQIWVNPMRGLQKKRNLERNLIQMEVFYEAVPSTMVMTYVTVKATGGPLIEGQELIFKWYDPESAILFFVAFTTSIFTSTLGLAKSLKVGPCRILPEQKKCLGGYLSPRFILIFFACGLTLISKGFALAAAVEGSCDPPAGAIGAGAAVAISLFFLPGFLIGLVGCWHQGILKTFLAQPSVFFLPVFSYFTCASSNSKACCGREKTDDGRTGEVESTAEETYVAFSPKSTAVNAAVSIVGVLVYAFILPKLSKSGDQICFEEVYVGGGLPCYFLGLFLTLVATFLDQCNISCSCSCLDLQPLEFAALLPTSPQTPYILIQTEDSALPLSMDQSNLEANF